MSRSARVESPAAGSISDLEMMRQPKARPPARIFARERQAEGDASHFCWIDICLRLALFMSAGRMMFAMIEFGGVDSAL